VERNPVESANAERCESPFVLQPAERALYGSPATCGVRKSDHACKSADFRARADFTHPTRSRRCRWRPRARTLVHLPLHASWLNQIEIDFSVVQRKVLEPDDFADRSAVARCLNACSVSVGQVCGEPSDWTCYPELCLPRLASSPAPRGSIDRFELSAGILAAGPAQESCSHSTQPLARPGRNRIQRWRQFAG
jgi:hypothetical protein